MLEDAIIRWTARLAVACYVGRLCCDASGPRVDVQRAGRWLWTLGFGFYLLHVMAAFQFLHKWSHSAAYEHVRQRSLNDIGWDSGFGIYVNYGFTLLWAMDVFLWWRRLDRPKSSLHFWIIQFAFGFMMFQATVVFGPRFWLPVCGAVILILVRIRRHRSATDFAGSTAHDA